MLVAGAVAASAVIAIAAAGGGGGGGQPACTQTFNTGNVGNSPFPGSNVRSAVAAGNSSTVLCFSSGSYGTMDIYGARPSGQVLMRPADGATVSGIFFSLNGVSNLKIDGFNGSSSTGGMLVQVAGQGTNDHITYSHN